MKFDKINISVRSEIPNFHLYEDLNSIEQDLNSYIKTLMPKINIQDLNDWCVLIIIAIRNTNAIGAFKRSRQYSSNREYEASVSIPIPDNQQASYSFHKTNEGFFCALTDKFYILEPNFKDYNHLNEYIVESSKRAINLLLVKGVTCGGKKIKFQE